MSFQIEIDGLEELETDWRRGVATIGTGTRKAVLEAVRTGERTAVAEAPHRTYQLRNKIEGRVLNTSEMNATGEVVSRAKYSSYVAEGTPPHEIAAKRAGALAFQVNGTTIFRRSVHHPGTKPNDFMERAKPSIEKSLETEMTTTVDAVCDDMSR